MSREAGVAARTDGAPVRSEPQSLTDRGIAAPRAAIVTRPASSESRRAGPTGVDDQWMVKRVPRRWKERIVQDHGRRALVRNWSRGRLRAGIRRFLVNQSTWTKEFAGRPLGTATDRSGTSPAVWKREHRPCRRRQANWFIFPPLTSPPSPHTRPPHPDTGKNVPPQTPRPPARRLADHRQAAWPDQHGRGQPCPPGVRRAESRPWRHARPARHRGVTDRVRGGDRDWRGPWKA